MTKINLGAGFSVDRGWVDVDKRDLEGIDVVHNLDTYPWPFEDNCAREIRATDIFEHLNDVVAAMDECRRILRHRCLLTIRGPLPTSQNLWRDVTHRRAFVLGSFDYFDWSTEYGRKYLYGCGSWELVSEYEEGDNVVFILEARK